jgi:hypothetical protein
MPKYDEKVEARIARYVVDLEYTTAKTNRSPKVDEFRSYLDMFDAVRSEKDYDWQSDIFIPEFPVHMLTQSALDVSQYFVTRDFVEVYIQDSSEEAKAAAQAAKECINRTLNQRELYHYPKFVRSKLINHLLGEVWVHCWWEQKLEQQQTGEKQVEVPLDVDIYGQALTNELQVPATRQEIQPVLEDVPVVDRFGYEVMDPRNVFTDSGYAYSAQQKKFVILRSEQTLEELKEKSKLFGYFNLEDLEKIKPDAENETKSETIEDDGEQSTIPEAVSGEAYEVLMRFGKYPFMPDGSPGIGDDGKITPGSKLEEGVITVAFSRSTKVLIGFHRSPYKDANGQRYRPLIRGLCYIHPTRDAGVGDGKYARELQVGVNDTFNLSNDRTRLATMPTLKGRKYVTDETDSIYFEPGHMMELENPDDVTEFQIQDNIQGALQQLGFLSTKLQETDAVYPTTMGRLPEQASTTATAVVEAGGKSSTRTQYKSLTFEYTFLTELYWMILQMTYAFAKPETGHQLMGDKVFDFDPTLDYFYKPVSQAIETDMSKNAKIQRWTNILGQIVNIGHPDAVKMVNFIFLEIVKLMGHEHEAGLATMLAPGQPLNAKYQEQGPGGSPVSNQNRIPMSGQEQVMREAASG